MWDSVGLLFMGILIGGPLRAVVTFLWQWLVATAPESMVGGLSAISIGFGCLCDRILGALSLLKLNVVVALSNASRSDYSGVFVFVAVIGLLAMWQVATHAFGKSSGDHHRGHVAKSLCRSAGIGCGFVFLGCLLWQAEATLSSSEATFRQSILTCLESWSRSGPTSECLSPRVVLSLALLHLLRLGGSVSIVNSQMMGRGFFLLTQLNVTTRATMPWCCFVPLVLGFATLVSVNLTLAAILTRWVLKNGMRLCYGALCTVAVKCRNTIATWYASLRMRRMTVWTGLSRRASIDMTLGKVIEVPAEELLASKQIQALEAFSEGLLRQCRLDIVTRAIPQALAYLSNGNEAGFSRIRAEIRATAPSLEGDLLRVCGRMPATPPHSPSKMVGQEMAIVGSYETEMLQIRRFVVPLYTDTEALPSNFVGLGFRFGKQLYTAAHNFTLGDVESGRLYAPSPCCRRWVVLRLEAAYSYGGKLAEDTEYEHLDLLSFNLGDEHWGALQLSSFKRLYSGSRQHIAVHTVLSLADKSISTGLWKKGAESPYAVHYASTAPGSSGAPVFVRKNGQMLLVGMHCGMIRGRAANYGLDFSDIVGLGKESNEFTPDNSKVVTMREKFPLIDQEKFVEKINASENALLKRLHFLDALARVDEETQGMSWLAADDIVDFGHERVASAPAEDPSLLTTPSALPEEETVELKVPRGMTQNVAEAEEIFSDDWLETAVTPGRLSSDLAEQKRALDFARDAIDVEWCGQVGNDQPARLLLAAEESHWGFRVLGRFRSMVEYKPRSVAIPCVTGSFLDVVKKNFPGVANFFLPAKTALAQLTSLVVHAQRFVPHPRLDRKEVRRAFAKVKKHVLKEHKNKQFEYEDEVDRFLRSCVSGNFEKDYANAKLRDFLFLFKDINLRSSPGVAHVHLGRTNRDVLVNHAPAIVRFVAHRIESLGKGKSCDEVKLFTKEEPHSKKKVDAERWRLIASVGLVDQIVERLLSAPLNKWCIDNFHRLMVKPGLDLMSKTKEHGRYHILRYFNDETKPKWSTDVSNFDWSVEGDLLVEESRMRAELFPAWARKLFENHTAALVESPMVLGNGLVLQQAVPGIQRSGRYNTSSSNSFIRLAMQYLIDEGTERCAAMGDDFVHTTKVPMSPEKLVKRYHDKLGLKVEVAFGGPAADKIEFCSHLYKYRGKDGLESSVPANVDKMLANFFMHTQKVVERANAVDCPPSSEIAVDAILDVHTRQLQLIEELKDSPAELVENVRRTTKELLGKIKVRETEDEFIPQSAQMAKKAKSKAGRGKGKAKAKKQPTQTGGNRAKQVVRTVTAPMATAMVLQPATWSIRSVGRNSIRITGTEYLGVVSAHATAYPTGSPTIRAVFDLNPSTWTSKLARQASMWEKYRYNRFTVRYVPRVGTNFVGSLGAYVETDPVEDFSKDFPGLLANGASQLGSVWTPFKLEYSRDNRDAKWYFASAERQANLRDVSQGNVVFLGDGPDQNTGIVVIDYDIDFLEPELESSAVPSQWVPLELSVEKLPSGPNLYIPEDQMTGISDLIPPRDTCIAQIALAQDLGQLMAAALAPAKPFDVFRGAQLFATRIEKLVNSTDPGWPIYSTPSDAQAAGASYDIAYNAATWTSGLKKKVFVRATGM